MRRALAYALVALAALGAALAVYVTSDRPDGLEHAARELGLDAAPPPAAAATPRWRRAAVALLGTAAAGAALVALGRALARRSAPPRDPRG